MQILCRCQLLLELTQYCPLLLQKHYLFRGKLIGLGLEPLPEIGNETGVFGISLGNGHHHAGIVFNLLRIDQACPDAPLVKEIKKKETVVACRLHHALVDGRVKP